MRWYQRISDAGVEWTKEMPCYWSPKFRFLASVESDVMPREEYFDRSGACQSSYNPPRQEPIMPQEWEVIFIDEIPLEKMREVVTALVNHLRLELKKSERFYSETKYKFVER